MITWRSCLLHGSNTYDFIMPFMAIMQYSLLLNALASLVKREIKSAGFSNLAVGFLKSDSVESSIAE